MGKEARPFFDFLHSLLYGSRYMPKWCPALVNQRTRGHNASTSRPASSLHLPHDIAQTSKRISRQVRFSSLRTKKPTRFKKIEEFSLPTELCGIESGPLCTRGGLCPGTKQKTLRRESKGKKGCARRIGGESGHLRSRRAENRLSLVYTALLPTQGLVADGFPYQIQYSLFVSAAQGVPRTAFNCQGCGKRKFICQFECSLELKTTSLTASHQISLNISHSPLSHFDLRYDIRLSALSARYLVL